MAATKTTKPKLADHEKLIKDLIIARIVADRANAKLKAANEALTDYMAAHQMKTASWRDNKTVYSATYVQAQVPKIDEAGLREALTAQVYDRYTTSKLDTKALEAAMDAGEIDSKTVLAHVEMVNRAPHVRFSEKEDNDG